MVAWANREQVRTGHRIVFINIDRGELKSERFDKWCAERGISLSFTAPDTSAHNSWGERIHLTLMDQARAMRVSCELPPSQWDEFMATAAYTRAQTASRRTGKTPYELYEGKKPDLSHMREIGCKAFVLQPHNTKVGPRGEEFVLIGYARNSKAYRCYHRATKRVVESFHVCFVERKDEEERAFHPGRVIGPLSSNNEIFSESASLPRPVRDSKKEEDGVESEPGPSEASQTPVDPIMPVDPEPGPSEVKQTPVKTATTIETVIDEESDNDILCNTKQESKPTAKKKAMMEEESRRAARKAKRVERVRMRTTASTDTQEVLSAFLESVRRGEQGTESSAPFDDLDEMLDGLAALGEDLPDIDDPTSFRASMLTDYQEQWRQACESEISGMEDMEVFKLVPCSEVPSDRKVLKGKWVLTVKRDKTGRPVRFKARYILCGYEQILGRDYNRTTSPTARMESFRVLLHIAASLDWDLKQFDVKQAFLDGVLEPDEVQFMAQPNGFEEVGKESYVWRVEKGIYGMHQAGRIWNKTMHAKMIAWGFTQLACEYCVYVRNVAGNIVLVAVHVDDFLSVANSPGANEEFKAQLESEWMIAEGDAEFCLGIEIERDRENKVIFISQKAMIDRIVDEFGQSDAYPVSTPMAENANSFLTRPPVGEVLSEEERLALAKLPYRSLIGQLLYPSIGTRPDISYAVRKLSEFLDCYQRSHWDAAIWIVHYLKGSRDLRLRLGGGTIDLKGFTDSSWGDCLDGRRSSMGYCYTLGGGIVSWSAKKQKVVVTSSTEAEYIAALESCKEGLWLRTMLLLIPVPVVQIDDPTPLYCDNNGAVCLALDPQFHSRSKHFDIRYHFIRQCVDEGKIGVERVSTTSNLADVFTKPLSVMPFARFRGLLGLC